MCDLGQFRPRSAIFRPPSLQAQKDDKVLRHNNYGSAEAQQGADDKVYRRIISSVRT